MTSFRSAQYLMVVAMSVSIILGLACPAFAQSENYVTNSNLRGVVPFGSYQFGQVDNINIATGALNLHIPLFTRKGRGLDDGRYVVYNSKDWTTVPVFDPIDPEIVKGFLWQKHYPSGLRIGSLHGGSLEYTHHSYLCKPGDDISGPTWANVRSNFIYRAPDGAQYRFPNRDYFISGGPYCTQQTAIANDHDIGYSDSGVMELRTTSEPYILLFKDGRSLTFKLTGTEVKDSNGNVINHLGDTLKRQYPVESNQLKVNDSNGNQLSHTWETALINIDPSFPTQQYGEYGEYLVFQESSVLSVITRLTLPNGRTYVFTYDDGNPQTTPNYGEITRIDLPSGGYIRYEYVTKTQWDQGPEYAQLLDSRRVSKRFVSADGVTERLWQYQYDRQQSPLRYITTVTDPDGNTTVYTFDSDGIHELSRVVKNGAGETLQTVDQLWQCEEGPVQTGQDDVTQMDKRDWRIISTTTALGSKVTQTTNTYDSFGYTFSISGMPLQYTGSRVNVTETSEYDYGLGVRGPLMRRTIFSYLHAGNDSYRNRHLWDRPTQRTIYDGSGNVKAQAIFAYDTTPIAATSGMTQHDDANYPSSMPFRGNLTERRDWLDSTGQWLQTSHWYDDLGNVVQTRSPKMTDTFFSYQDSWGNSACAPPPDTARAFVTQTRNALNHITSRRYNSCTSLMSSDMDANSRTTSYSYDGMDRILEVVRPDASKTRYYYDDVARFVWISSDQYAPNDNELQSAILYDGLGRTVETRTYEETGYIATKYVLDAFGRVSFASNPYRPASESPVWTMSSYDALGRLMQVMHPDGAMEAMEYLGNVTTVTDSAGKKRRSTTDALGRVTMVTEDPLGLAYQTNYSYDALDNLIYVQQGGQTRTFAYDSLGRLTSAVNPESGTIAYQYDGNGNLTQKSDARGTISYTYDELDRLNSRSYTDGTAMVSFGYDAAGVTNSKGRLTSVVSAVSSYGYDEYDALGRIKRSSQLTEGNQYLFSYGYNLAGGMIAQTYPSGRAVLTSYDTAGRIEGLMGQKAGEADRTYASSFGYAAHGAVKALQLGNGLWEQASYNGRLQPTQMGLGTTSAGANVLGLTYSYGGAANNGNVLSQAIAAPGWSRMQSYSYDGLNRLEQAAETGVWTQGYGYDRYGNRWVTAGSYVPTAALTPQSQAAFNASNNRLTGSQYDGSGNQTQDAAGRTFAYDLENRQTSFTSVGLTVSYSYDGEGRRVKKVEPAGTTIYVYDALGRLAAEYSNAAPAGEGGTSYLTADHLGSTRVVTDGGGAVKKRYDYLSFGEEIPWTIGGRSSVAGYLADDATRQKFSGKERDAESGLDYFGARYFSGAQGRFTSPDPYSIMQKAESREELDEYLGDPRRWNKYAYSLNNPLKYVDPDGNNPFIPLLQLLQRVAASPTGQRVLNYASNQVVRLTNAATRFFNSPTGQEVTQTAIEIAVGHQGPSPTVTGNVGRLANAELETGVRLAQKLGQSVRVSDHVGAEFVSAAGKTFDALGSPEAYKFWSQGQFLKSIDKHLLKSNDFTVIDLTGASKAQAAAIQKHVSSLAKELKDRIIYVGN